MLEMRGDPDLAEEALRTQDRAKLGENDLQGDETIVPEIASQVHRGHTAAPELALEHISAGQGIS
jgi:hypothetical protein